MTRSDQPVVLVPHDPSWAEQFERERALLASALAPWLEGGIEHVGSTAIPGIAAKPVIDIMAGVRDLAGSLDARHAVAPLQYQYFPYKPDVMHWFCKPSPSERTHHLHLIPHGSRLWDERLAFRDYLCTHADVAHEYAALKESLAGRHALDREAYTEAKGPFVQMVIEQAMDARRRTSGE